MKRKKVIALLMVASMTLGSVLPVMAEENIISESQEIQIQESEVENSNEVIPSENEAEMGLQESLQTDIPSAENNNEVIVPENEVEMGLQEIQQTDMSPIDESEKVMGTAGSDAKTADNSQENVGSASSEQIGDQFKEGDFTYEITSDTTVSMVEYSLFGAPDMVVPQQATYEGESYQVTGIQRGACHQFPNIETITVPEGVTQIDELVFTQIPNLRSIDIQDANATCATVDGVMYSADMSELRIYPTNKQDESYTTPESVTTIKRFAMTGANYLKSLTFSDSVSVYDDRSVSTLGSTEVITTGTGTSKLGQGVFADCQNLRELTLQGDSISMMMYAVFNSPNLETITLNGNISMSMGYNFYNLPRLKEFVVTNSTQEKAVDGVLYMGDTLMVYPPAKEGKTYVVPEETKQIGPLAFSYSQNLTSVIVAPGAFLSEASFNSPTNPLNIYMRDDNSANIVKGVTIIFLDFPAGSHVYGKNQNVVNSILANPNWVDAGISVEVGAIPASSVSVDVESATINIGEKKVVKATTAPYYATETVTWESSNPKVATVDDNGNITAVAVGDVDITAKAGKVSSVCKVSVKSPLKGISLDKAEVSLKKGGTSTLKVTYNPTDTTDSKEVTWTSSNDDVAVVSDEGKIIAKARGTATITAKVGSFTATCKVSVGVPLEGISISKDKVTLNTGEKTTLSVGYLPEDTTDSKNVVWETSNDGIASVKDGIVTAKSGGTATITAKVGSYTETCIVTVKSPLNGISLNIDKTVLERGKSTSLVVIFNPDDTTDSKEVEWSSSNPSVASVDNKGKITTSEIGSAVIKARVGNKTATCSVTVTALLKSISLDKNVLNLKEGGSETLKVSLNPTDTTDSKDVSWMSSNEDVVKVSANGKVTAKAAGIATITATVGKQTAQCKVTVAEVGIHYPDVTKDAWYYNSVKWATLNGVMTGYNNGNFGPSDYLTRGQVATILYRVEGSPAVEYQNVYPDVPNGTFYSIPAVWARQSNVITGYDNGKFGALDLLTREQLATMLYRYAKSEGYDTSMKADLSRFPDAKNVSSFAREAMQWAVAVGMISGDQGKLNPQGNSARAVAATIMMRFENAYK